MCVRVYRLKRKLERVCEERGVGGDASLMNHQLILITRLNLIFLDALFTCNLFYFKASGRI